MCVVVGKALTASSAFRLKAGLNLSSAEQRGKSELGSDLFFAALRCAALRCSHHVTQN
jgi:hypothetical protein